jgi:phosphonate metabolism protein PhnN/1,5-bisphosphokinase (PRPP-forming)
MSGVLFLVVGPSGAGKDTLISGAKDALGGDRRFVFPTRFITRGGDAGGEPHMPVDIDEFAHLKDGGFFALAWEAHGLSYGIPGGIVDDLARGRNVVVNVSRHVIDQARQLFARVHVIVVTAPQDVLAQRLRARGREDQADIAERLMRTEVPLQDTPSSTIHNAGSVEAGVEAFVAELKSALR